MKRICKSMFIPLLIFMAHACYAQTDTILPSLQQVPLKYIKQVDSKMDKYTSRITNKTEKTLTKLSRWENKIRTLLEKTNPAAAQKLFANNQLTFTAALEKYKKGEVIVANQKARYDTYRDKLTTNLDYLAQQKDKLDEKYIAPVKNAKEKADELNKQEDNIEAMQQFIKERKKQLMDEAVKYIGNSKYLAKINKESYYYVETLKNYKEIFSDKKKAEETALTILNKIPAFKNFVQKNSMLAQIFGAPSVSPPGGTGVNLAGLQTRAIVNALIQNQLAAGGPNVTAQIRQNIEAAQAQLSQLKDKILKAGGNGNDTDVPDFKVKNTQKTKTLKQRIEVGSNVQFSKNNVAIPTTADLGLSVGYKLNDKSIVGIGASYKMGLGSIQHISISHQGIGLRSYVDWQMKKQFYLSGGYEMNYNAAFKNIEQLQQFNSWSSSGLVGISKRIAIKSKLTKGTKLSLLYDMLYHDHVPVSQPVVFRVGYNF